MSGLTALVLAGTRAGGDPLARHAGVSHKALIEVGGSTMIERVVRSLDALPALARIVVAIERAAILAPLAGLRTPPCRHPVMVVPSAAGPSASVTAVLAAEGTPLLVTTADHALLRTEWLQQLLDATPPSADAAVALARREQVVAAAPDTRRTWLRFAEGDYSGCNLFLLQRPAAAGVVAFWQQLEAERRRPFAMMRRLGIGHALRYALRRLRCDEAVARLGELSGARIAIVEMADGRAAIDVDKPEDLALVRRLVAGMAPPG